eukprot:TRINITY_DN4108_c0_g1_i1.p1 TRINITY_DN4108_c0_g1~~TRINITY_DN4108_c0_g1_i1.p1  ORF type:complete len:108 (-),score=33.92 TRINITY_DN4108_c0_g1_i1:114-437(-)
MNAFLLLLVTLAMLLSVVNAGILCDNETWTNCNDRYKKCQGGNNPDRCACFRDLIVCGASTGCMSEAERKDTIAACTFVCQAALCSDASTPLMAGAALIAALAARLF